MLTFFINYLKATHQIRKAQRQYRRLMWKSKIKMWHLNSLIS